MRGISATFRFVYNWIQIWVNSEFTRHKKILRDVFLVKQLLCIILLYAYIVVSKKIPCQCNAILCGSQLRSYIRSRNISSRVAIGWHTLLLPLLPRVPSSGRLAGFMFKPLYCFLNCVHHCNALLDIVSLQRLVFQTCKWDEFTSLKDFIYQQRRRPTWISTPEDISSPILNNQNDSSCHVFSWDSEQGEGRLCKHLIFGLSLHERTQEVAGWQCGWLFVLFVCLKHGCDSRNCRRQQLIFGCTLKIDCMTGSWLQAGGADRGAGWGGFWSSLYLVLFSALAQETAECMGVEADVLLFRGGCRLLVERLSTYFVSQSYDDVCWQRLIWYIQGVSKKR